MHQCFENDFAILPLMQPNPDETPVDIKKIQALCSQTLVDLPPEDRCLAWMALLEVYPKNPNEWQKATVDYTNFYWEFVKEFKVEDWHTKYFPENPTEKLPKTLALIHIDIYRTARAIMHLPATSPRVGKDHLSPFSEHMRRLERILYIFSCCNPTLGYMQGFNELLVPLYFTVIHSPSLFHNDIRLMEAVVFQMFQHLITSTPVQNMYLMQDKTIVFHEIEKFSVKIRQYLPKVADLMERENIQPAFYCYRWFTLLFAQEHDLPSLLLIWDNLFAHIDNFFEYTFCLGLGHLKMVDKQLLSTDFAKSLEILQNLHIIDITPVIKYSEKIWKIEKMKQKFSFSTLFSHH